MHYAYALARRNRALRVQSLNSSARSRRSDTSRRRPAREMSRVGIDEAPWTVVRRMQ